MTEKIKTKKWEVTIKGRTATVTIMLKEDGSEVLSVCFNPAEYKFFTSYSDMLEYIGMSENDYKSVTKG